jgi:hypothetical protein
LDRYPSTAGYALHKSIQRQIRILLIAFHDPIGLFLQLEPKRWRDRQLGRFYVTSLQIALRQETMNAGPFLITKYTLFYL